MKKESSETIYYPVSLNVSGRKCLVIGGGEVAYRKVLSLLEHGACVTVISPKLNEGLSELAEKAKIEARKRKYQTGDLAGAFVAIAATDSREINHAISAEAREKAVLVNVVDDAEVSDFIAPSHLRRGDVSIAITTSGKSPALARKIRTRLEKEFSDEYAALALLLAEVRAQAKEMKLKVDSEGWQESIDLDLLLELLRKNEIETARDTLLGNLKLKQRPT